MNVLLSCIAVLCT